MTLDWSYNYQTNNMYQQVVPAKIYVSQKSIYAPHLYVLYLVKRVLVYVSEWVCVCRTHLFSFFPLAFVLVNDLSLVSLCFLFWKCVRFCFSFGAVCFFLLYALVFYVYCHVTYQMFFHWCSFMYPHWGFWNKLLDLTLPDVRSAF